MHRIETVVPATRPFAFTNSLEFFQGFPPCAGDQQLTSTTITKGVSLGGQAMAVRVGEHPEGVRVLALSDQPFRTTAAAELAPWTTNLFSLDDDLNEFYALAASDHPAFAAITARLRGLHHVRFPSVVEAAVWFVLTQRTPQRVALGTKRRIAAALGRGVTINGIRHQGFPELDDLLPLGVDDWRAFVPHERKASYLTNVVHGIADLGIDHLATAPYAQATAELRAIVGVGEFTAAAILLRGLGRMDFVPLGMPSFVEPARAVYGDDYDPERIRAHYGPHLGYWSYYLKSGSGSMLSRARPAA